MTTTEKKVIEKNAQSEKDKEGKVIDPKSDKKDDKNDKHEDGSCCGGCGG